MRACKLTPHSLDIQHTTKPVPKEFLYYIYIKKIYTVSEPSVVKVFAEIYFQTLN